MTSLRQRALAESPLDTDSSANVPSNISTSATHIHPASVTEHVSDKHWWQTLDPSLTLENKGSVARDHLANERTFLAWIRTSLSLITVGVAISQLFRLPYVNNESPNGGTPLDGFRLPTTGKILGSLFIGLGILFVLMAAWRYFRAQTAMTHGMFPTSRLLVIISCLFILLLLIALMTIVLIERRTLD